ncbi:MAG: Asp-tRNA(Asn)/Glu-tRNA(Gln) amidotransferase subunit GatC [Planctomycetales bacterium]|jgi:aspartyl-tRNA(Asn)/glutamyl-tRNA(Gln) amidotransferase subunit C|nr:Asp-tRNA(Asn)/Glu-tRNA(Gln) amidotransferase subunit GatC [Planctomycetales bacterium]
MATQLTRADVQKVALLGRLKLSDAELEAYTQSLGNIIGYVERLNEVNTDDVEPMVHAVELSNVFRADEVRPSLPRADALANAPKSERGFFLVPQILDER